MLASVLWELLGEGQVQDLSTDGSAGHRFEDLTVEKVYAACQKLATLKPLLPRYTLKLPTVSGLHHQIDVIVREGTSGYHLTECKFKQSVSIEELYALNAKLLDYAFGAMIRAQKTQFRGYFFTTSPKVNDNFHKYALAWGIVLVAPGGPPPLEHMLSKAKPDTALHDQLTTLVEKTSGGTQPAELAASPREAEKLLAQWRACYQYWKREGYDS